MTDGQLIRIAGRATDLVATVMTITEMSCVAVIENEDLENEDAEMVIKMFLVAFKEEARAILRDNIIRKLNEKR